MFLMIIYKIKKNLLLPRQTNFACLTDFWSKSSQKNTTVDKSEILYKLSANVPGLWLKNCKNIRFFAFNYMPRFGSIGKSVARPVMQAPKGARKSGTHSLRVKKYSETFKNVRSFVEIKVLSLNGVINLDKVLSKMDKHSIIQHVPKIGVELSKPEKEFVTELNNVTKSVHDFITAQSVMHTTPEGNFLKISYLDSPVIYQMSNGLTLTNIYGRNIAGHLTNIRRQTKKLDTHCFVYKKKDQIKNLFKPEFKLTIEQRFDSKVAIHRQKVDGIPVYEFEGFSFTKLIKEDLQTVCSFAGEMSKRVARTVYNTKNISSSEYYAAGFFYRARNVINQLGLRFKALYYKLDQFTKHQREIRAGLDYNKLGTTTYPLFFFSDKQSFSLCKRRSK